RRGGRDPGPRLPRAGLRDGGRAAAGHDGGPDAADPGADQPLRRRGGAARRNPARARALALLSYSSSIGKAIRMWALPSTMKSWRVTSPPSLAVISTSVSGMNDKSPRLIASENRLWKPSGGNVTSPTTTCRSVSNLARSLRLSIDSPSFTHRLSADGPDAETDTRPLYITPETRADGAATGTGLFLDAGDDFLGRAHRHHAVARNDFVAVDPFDRFRARTRRAD